MTNRWIINSLNEDQKKQQDEIAKQLSINPILAKLLVQRGITTFDEAKQFFRPSLNALHDPFLMTDMQKAVDRLNLAIGKNEKIMVYGDDYDTPDGSCIRDYIHVTDLAQAHMKALYAPSSGHYNLGTGNGLSVFEIIEAARRVTGHAIPMEIAPRRPGDPPRLIADSRRARAELNWQPEFENADAIISSVWQWMQKYPDGYQDK